MLVAVLGGGLYAYNRYESNNEAGEANDQSNSITTPSDTDVNIGSRDHETLNPGEGDKGGDQNVPVIATSTNSDTINKTSSTTPIGGKETSTPKMGNATVSFNVPDHNVNKMTIDVKVANSIISEVTFSEEAKDQASQYWLDNFTKSLDKSKIVGKKLSDVSLSKVGGASLTTKAFMNALNQAVSKTI